MPIVRCSGQSIECPAGANLRVVLLRARLPLYNSVSQALNCRGRGVCGTCAVEIHGDVSPPTEAEQRRLGMFPHQPGAGLRLACQCRVVGDVEVTKHGGLWGHARKQGS
jgi:ferredoxin